MNNKSELAKVSESVTKKIVDNVNNVLGILPQPLSFEFNRPRKRVHHRKAKAKTSHRRRPSVARKAASSASRGVKKAKRAGGRLKKRAKSAITSARKSAAARKAHHPRKRHTAKVIPLRRSARKSHSHSRAA